MEIKDCLLPLDLEATNESFFLQLQACVDFYLERVPDNQSIPSRIS